MKINIIMLTYCLNSITYMNCKKPHKKRAQEIWLAECDVGAITDPDCPVDGAWAPWGPWSPCSGLCDQGGQRRRTRECTNPPPFNGGTPCIGHDEETEECHLTNCTVDNFRKIIEGDLMRMEAFHQLDAVPALTEKCLLMECPYEAIEAALNNDNTWELNSETLWNSLQCIKHHIGCAVIGGWSEWSPWSACGARCGVGQRWRLRRCDAPPPSEERLICVGLPLLSERCEGDQCAIDKKLDAKNIGGSWGPWGPWSPSSESCGSGIKRRRRVCNEVRSTNFSTSWGTHCHGPFDQFEVNESKKCILNGEWSGWGSWGPCSQSCGAGRRSRTRSCTRPVPAGGGTPCVGARTEVGSCYMLPCDVYSHTVCKFDGDGVIHYFFERKRSRLLHFYARFCPRSPYGTILRRGTIHNPLVRLSLQNWHVCVDANGGDLSCSLARSCSPVLDPAMWHSVLLTVTSDSVVMRLDDVPSPIKVNFPCDPNLPSEEMNIWIGEKFHGEIEKVSVNFMPLKLKEPKDTVNLYNPSSRENFAFEKASIEEAYLNLEDGQYLCVPCFDYQEAFQIELIAKSDKGSGTVLFMRNQYDNNWILISLQNSRLRIKLAVVELKSESISDTEIPPGQWFHVKLSKKKESSNIEVVINSEERLHAQPYDGFIFSKGSNTMRDIYNNSPDILLNGTQNVNQPLKKILLCDDEYYIGGLPEPLSSKINENITPFTGILASLVVNGDIKDLHEFSLERYKDSIVQLSSRTASISAFYHETAWGSSDKINLTCLHARGKRSPYKAHWLLLDKEITHFIKNKSIRSVDDGRVLRLVASPANEIKGFYTCRAHSDKRSRNIVTYGVLEKLQHGLSRPDATTALAVFTTLTLVVATLVWLIIEGLYDIRNGYGFFRDRHLSPQEAAECVCSYIDENIDIVGSPSTAQLAKACARRKARQLASRLSFGAQEPQGIMEIPSNWNSSSEADICPSLPAIRNSTSKDRKTLTCEHVSSLLHSNPPQRSHMSSASSAFSPRVICSRLIVAKKTQRKHTYSKTRRVCELQNIKPSPKCNLLTIKSSKQNVDSPAIKVLKKFLDLKRSDE